MVYRKALHIICQEVAKLYKIEIMLHIHINIITTKF